jgi:hypothetical protein
MNDVSGFDPNVFLGATLTDANTRRPPIPGGTTVRGTLGEPTYRQNTGKKDTNQGVIYHSIDIPVEIDLTSVPALRDQIGQDKVTLKYGFMLDVSPAGGMDMSPGKNNGLRQLREAVGMNNPGEPFSIQMVQGRQVLAKIGNRPYNNEVFDEVQSIAKIT